MKLLVISPFYPPLHLGGYEIRCKEVIDGLTRRGHEALILTTRSKGGECNDDKEVYSIERKLRQRVGSRNLLCQIFTDILDMKFIDHRINQFSPDIIYLWGIQTLSNALFPFLSRQNIQIVYDEGSSGLIHMAKIYARGIYFYNNENDPIVKKNFKKFINQLVNILSSNRITPQWIWPHDMQVYFNCTSSMKYAWQNGVPIGNASVIYSGIDIEKFPYQFREQINPPVRIIVPARIKPIKGTRDAIGLVRELKKRNIDVKLQLVGKVQSDEYLDEINQEIIQNDLATQVEILPMVSQSELSVLYRRSDICFCPSYLKPGFSRVPLEAMASGCVVITYGNEGAKEVIRDQETGLIISEGDFSFAANLIEELIKMPSLVQNISGNAYQQVEQGFTLDRYIGSIETYLLQCIQRSNITN